MAFQSAMAEINRDRARRWALLIFVLAVVSALAIRMEIYGYRAFDPGFDVVSRTNPSAISATAPDLNNSEIETVRKGVLQLACNNHGSIRCVEPVGYFYNFRHFSLGIDRDEQMIIFKLRNTEDKQVYVSSIKLDASYDCDISSLPGFFINPRELSGAVSFRCRDFAEGEKFRGTLLVEYARNDTGIISRSLVLSF
jgi:hypothetical protein